MSLEFIQEQSMATFLGRIAGGENLTLKIQEIHSAPTERYSKPGNTVMNELADEAARSLLEQIPDSEWLLKKYTEKGMRRIMRKVVKNVLYAHYHIKARRELAMNERDGI